MILTEHRVPKDNADDVLLVRKKYFESGDFVKSGDEVLDLETSKTAVIMTTESDGYVQYHCNSGDKVCVGDLIFTLHDNVSSFVEVDKERKITSDDVKLSRPAQKYVDEHNIDISTLRLAGLVSLDALKKSLDLSHCEVPLISSDSLDADDDIASNPISLAKTNEIKALTSVNQTGLVSTVCTKIKVSPNASYFQMGLLREIVFEVSRLLKSYPLLNAYFENQRIFLHPHINVGFAVDVDDGLKVLVTKETDKLSFSKVTKSIELLVDKYLEKTLTVSDITQGTFTVTDLSSYGVSSFTPLVNDKQSGMLGVSALDDVTNTVEISLSFDHRVTEGKYAANFLMDLKRRMESLLVKSTLENTKCSRCLKTLSDDKSMGGVGFYEVLNHDGSQALICQVCAAGW